jgi:phospholipid-binding lipoprotein MlaA
VLRVRVIAVLLAVLAVLPGCVQMNETAYELNRHLAVAVQPVVGVLLLVPEPLRERVRLFFANLRYGDVVVNQFLQGKPRLAVKDFARWVVNSTAGIAGFFDVATELGLEAHDEDFGQTLAVWGFPEGRYLVLPILGPTTDRDLAGRAIAFATNPTFWVNDPLVSTPVTVLSYANGALQAGKGLRELQSEAADPEVFMREAYRQRRRYLIYDGQPPRHADEALEELDLDSLGQGAESAGGEAAAEPAGSEDAEGEEGLPGLPGLEEATGSEGASVDALPGLEEAGEKP